MYEVKYKVKTTKLHPNLVSYQQEWIKDFPDFDNIIQQEMIRNPDIYQIYRKDPTFNVDGNYVEKTVLFETLQGALDYTRWVYNTLYSLQVDKTTYNDVQFKEYLLNTDITILDGKYIASVVSITEVGI